AGNTEIAHCGNGFLEELARIELTGVLGQEAPHCTGSGQAQVGIDIDLAYAVLDTLNDLFNRHAVGLGNVTAVLIDNGKPLLGHRRGTVHHQVCVGDAGVNFFDTLNGESVAGGWTSEFVGAVAGTDSDGQGIDVGGLDEVGGFFGV